VVLLDANPIASVEKLDCIWAVVLQGRSYSKSPLDKMKDDGESRP
jgi:hypothetical protein